MKKLLTFILTLTILISYAQNDWWKHWEKHENNPIMVGEDGTWYKYVSNPSVLYENGIFKMWFRGHTGSNFQIGYAYSNDGLEWSIREDPVIPPGEPTAWDYGKSIGSILRVNDTLKMWYVGSNYNHQEHAIGHAWSVEEHVWNFYPEPVLDKGETGTWDQYMVYGGRVYYDGIKYHMWYTGIPGASSFDKIGYATSDNGIDWEKDYDNSPVISTEPFTFFNTRVINGDVIIYNDTMHMFFIGYNGVPPGDYKVRLGHALTTDYVNWTVSIDTALDVGEPGSWEDKYVTLPTVMYLNGAFHIWYEGRPDAIPSSIGYAVILNPGTVEIKLNNASIECSPNPFTTSTTHSYELKQPEKVSLSIYNHLGQIVYQIEENQPQGSQQLIWNAERYADGVYYYRLKVGDQVASGKMVKVK